MDGFPGGIFAEVSEVGITDCRDAAFLEFGPQARALTRGDGPDVRPAEAVAVPCLVVSLVHATCIDWRHGAGLPFLLQGCLVVVYFPTRTLVLQPFSYRQQRLVEVGEVHVVDILGLGGLVTEGFDDVPFVAYRHDRLEYVRE